MKKSFSPIIGPPVRRYVRRSLDKGGGVTQRATCPAKPWRRRKCSIKFTLIELLVVIGIIAILLTILLPGLKKARDASYGAVCGNNLKQLYLCVDSYANNNDLLLPRGDAWVRWLNYQTGTNYIQNMNICLCPMDKTPQTDPYGNKYCYGINWFFVTNSDANYSNSLKKWYAVKNPGNKIMFADWEDNRCGTYTPAVLLKSGRHPGQTFFRVAIDGNIKKVDRDYMNTITHYGLSN